MMYEKPLLGNFLQDYTNSFTSDLFVEEVCGDMLPFKGAYRKKSIAQDIHSHVLLL